MKFKKTLIIPLISFMPLTLASCSEDALIALDQAARVEVYNDTTKIGEYFVKYGESFSLSELPADTDTETFVGCYASKDGSGDMYVDSFGQSIVWNSTDPKVVYVNYQDVKDLSLTTNEAVATGEYQLGGTLDALTSIDESGGVKLSFHKGFLRYFKEHPTNIYDVSVSFDHHEMTASAFINWSNYQIYLGNKAVELDSGSIASIEKYRTFSKTFHVTGDDLYKSEGDIGILLSLPVENVAGNASGCWYKKFIATITHGEIPTVDNVSFEKYGKRFVEYYPNSGRPYSLASPTQEYTNVPKLEIPALLAEKYLPTTITLKFHILSHGEKAVLMSNWVDFYVNALDNEYNNILASDYKNSVGDGSKDKDVAFAIDITVEQFLKIDHFYVKINRPSSNASVNVFFVYEFGFEVQFPDTFTVSASGDNLSLDSYNYRNEKTISVPETIAQKSVVRLANNAFSNHPELECIEVAANVEKLGNESCMSSNALQKVILKGDTLKTFVGTPIRAGVAIILDTQVADLLKQYKTAYPAYASYFALAE